MKCPECGSEINENSKLCDLCGHKIDMNIQSDNLIYGTKFPEKINDNVATQTTEKFDASKPNKSIGNGKIRLIRVRTHFILCYHQRLKLLTGILLLKIC